MWGTHEGSGLEGGGRWQGRVEVETGERESWMVKSLWEYKTGSFWAHFNNYSGIFLRNSL